MIRLVDYNNNFNGDFVYINEHSYNFLRKSQLFGGEIIISNVGANAGTVFKSPRLNYKMSLAPNAIMIKTMGNDDFYFYWFKSEYGQYALKSIVSGSAQPKFNKTDFRSIQIPVPPLIEQKAIADTLSCLDDKIELNNRINKTLEEMAQAIFKSWFVDFEPFQDSEFEDCELGRIPKGWRVEKLDEVMDISTRSINPTKINDIVLEHYSIPAYDNGKMPVFENATAIKSNKFIVDKNAFLVSKLNPSTKRYWKPFCISNNAVCSTEFIVYSSKIEEHLNFYFLLMDESRFFNFLTSNITGSTNSRQRVTPSTTLNFEFVCPPNDVIIEFVKIVDNLLLQIERNILENQTLTAIRDSLLPKLMSGEIKVPIEEV